MRKNEEETPIFTQYLPLVYDILAVVLVLGYIYRGSRQGLAATLVNLLGYAAALVAAWPVAGFIAQRVFELGLRGPLIDKVAERLAEHPEGGELLESAALLLETLPAYVGKLLDMDAAAMQRLADSLSSFSDNGARLIVDEVLAPVVTGALTAICFVIVFSLLLVVVRLVTRMFRAANDIPVIGPVNSVLGGVAGVGMGVVALYVLVLILRLVMVFTGDSLTFLNQELLEQTVAFRLLRNMDWFGLLGG